MPRSLEIDNKSYNLLCVILHRKDILHFVSVYDFENNKYLVDDMIKEAPLLRPEKLYNGVNYYKFNISSALYYLL